MNFFDKYTSNYDMNNKGINYKYYHSYRVMEQMQSLAKSISLSKRDIELSKCIGLLHDIVRFLQYTKYGNFNDDILYHGEYAIEVLKETNALNYFNISKEDYEVVYKAIKNHNKYAIESNLKERELLFSKMIRDMDKVDIFKQHAVHYPGVFNADEVTEDVLKQFKDEQPIDKNYRKTKTDGTLLVLSFVFDINFNESYDILVETDNFDLYLSTVELSENSEKLWNKIKEICFDKINRGV